jgi:tetratricopeptide (TPR) repeat protein
LLLHGHPWDGATLNRTVTRLKPRIAEYETALRAYREGDFSFCSDALYEAVRPAEVALRVRALLRTGRSTEALAAVAKLDLSALSHDDAAELLSLKATALCALADPEVEEVLIEARVRAYSSGCPAVECEAEYVAAALAWTQGRTDDALRGVKTVLAVSEHQPTWLRKSRPEASCSPGYWRARAYDLRGLAQAVDEDFSGQAKSLQKAFEEFDGASVQDLQVEASMLHNLSVLARDLDAPEIAAFVADRADRLAWNGNTLFFEHEVYKALGWCYAQRGDHLGAFRHLRRSADAAPTIPMRIIAILDRGFLARELGETLTATEDIDYAVRLTSQIDWELVSGAERSALYALASCVASTDAKQARRLWDRFASLKSPVSPFELYARGNRRERATQCQAHAAVLIAEGDRQRAISLLLESLSIWSEVGYAWREAATAADLAELTGERRFFEIAAKQVTSQSNSWLARRLSTLAAV